MWSVLFVFSGLRVQGVQVLKNLGWVRSDLNYCSLFQLQLVTLTKSNSHVNPASLAKSW